MDKQRRYRRKTFEIKFYEDLIKTRPDFAEALICLGNAYTQGGLFKEGLKIDLRLTKLKPNDPIVCYNLACSYSLLGDLDSAMKAIKKAVLLGYEDFSYLMKDKDLERLRQDPRLKKFINKVSLRLQKTLR